MNTPISLFLGTLIVGGLIVDAALFGSDHLVFLVKKFFELVEWIAFWR